MNAGEYRHRCYVLTPTHTPSAGGVTTTYAYWATIQAAVQPIGGRERMLAQQVESAVNYRLRTRYIRGLREDMLILAPKEETVLSAALSTTNGTSLTVVNALMPSSNPFYIRIDSEIMQVTAGHGTTTLTVTRGAVSTTAGLHVKFAPVIRLGQLEIDGIIDLDERRRELEIVCVEAR